MTNIAPPCECCSCSKKEDIPPGHKSGWQAMRRQRALILLSTGNQSTATDGSQQFEREDMIGAHDPGPIGKRRAHLREDAGTRCELDRMALAVIKAHRLDARETLKCPGEADRRVLSARKQH